VNASARSGAATLWVAGELPSTPGENAWAGGATADVSVSAGGESGTARVVLAPGERAFLTPVQMRIPAQAQLDVRVRVTAADRSATPATEITRVDVSPDVVQPLMFRRGATTSNRWRPAADFRFSRTERMRVEVPIEAGVKPGSGRLLDKNGNALDIPVTVAERADAASGQRWLAGEIALAALGPGDYVVEIGSTGPAGEQKVVTALRVTR
jgi:hypothetical protein